MLAEPMTISWTVLKLFPDIRVQNKVFRPFNLKMNLCRERANHFDKRNSLASSSRAFSDSSCSLSCFETFSAEIF